MILEKTSERSVILETVRGGGRDVTESENNPAITVSVSERGAVF